MSSERPARVPLMGIEIDSVGELEGIELILTSLARGQGGWVVTPNLDMIRLLTRSPELARLVAGADLVVADGMPLVWASRLAGNRLPERVAGSSMLFSLSDAAASCEKSVGLVGGAPGAASVAAERLRARSPALEVSALPLPMRFDPMARSEVEPVAQALRSSQPDIVFVGLGFPKQELLISQLRAALPQSWFIGVGVSLSFASGQVSRAPAWVQRIGLEWAHRLRQEPRRLAWRYVVHDLPFAVRLFAHALSRRLLKP